MKLERINENQIRCTLDSADFHMRQMTVKELTYRSPKAKELFRELLEKAEEELDFDANMPIMIEAIPTSEESVTLIVTRVEDPEEFDPRFARFAPNQVVDMSLDDFDEAEPSEEFTERADEIIELVRKFTEKLPNSTEEDDDELPFDYTSPKENQITNLCRAYVFSSLDDICETAQIIVASYDGENSVYKDTKTGRYILVVYQSEHTATEFNCVCNQLSEYSEILRGGNHAIAYCEEHFKVICQGNALQVLQDL